MYDDKPELMDVLKASAAILGIACTQHAIKPSSIDRIHDELKNWRDISTG
jgi:hypothetical protein